MNNGPHNFQSSPIHHKLAEDIIDNYSEVDRPIKLDYNYDTSIDESSFSNSSFAIAWKYRLENERVDEILQLSIAALSPVRDHYVSEKNTSISSLRSNTNKKVQDDNKTLVFYMDELLQNSKYYEKYGLNKDFFDSLEYFFQFFIITSNTTDLNTSSNINLRSYLAGLKVRFNKRNI